ncbi:hypothetical protein ACWERV_27280 [Streptomyces sp. NPDC004031]
MHTLHHIHDVFTALQPVLAAVQTGVGLAGLIARVRPKRTAPNRDDR